MFSYVLSLQDLVKTLVSFNTLPLPNPLANKSLALEQVISATTGCAFTAWLSDSDLSQPNEFCGNRLGLARPIRSTYLGASVVVFPGKTDAETLEALACREAVSLARDINAMRVQVASDCKNVIANLEKGTMGVDSHIVREI
jgi:hypothetical protein